MNSKRLLVIALAALTVGAVLTSLVMRDARRASAQTTGRKVIIEPGRNSPVEVTEVLWNGAPLRPGEGIPSGSDWIGNLQIRFKNKSDKPISFAMFLILDTAKPQNTSSLKLLYGTEYSTDTSEPTVAPGEYGVARPDIAMFGSTTGTTDLRIFPSQVVWNFNYDVLWSSGDLWEVDMSPNAKQKYRRVSPAPTPTPTPQVKSTLPGRNMLPAASFNHAPATRAAMSDPCENNPFTPECEELGPWCQYKLSGPDTTSTCTASGCGGAGQPHCFNSGCHPTGPAYCYYKNPTYNGSTYDVNKAFTIEYCRDASCPVNLCGDNVNHSGLVHYASTVPDDNCRRQASPIIVDMNGDSIKLTSAEEGVRFDLNANGKYEQVAWTTAASDDAFLTLDRNGDGKVKTGLELFGDVTEQPESENRNGFLALKVFDANGDNVISASDPVYSQLRLWTDSNHDGRSAPSELTTLAARGVKNISTDFKDSRRTDKHGNEFRYRAKVKDVKGADIGRWSWDVFLLAAAPSK